MIRAGSACSVEFGADVTSAAPGSFQNPHRVAPNIVDARHDRAERGIAVREVFHGAGFNTTKSLRPTWLHFLQKKGDDNAISIQQA